MSLAQIKFRVHEWLADRIQGRQYPRITPAQPRTPDWETSQGSPFIKVNSKTGEAKLDFFGKFAMFIFSLFSFAIGLGLLAFCGIALWAIASSFFS